MESKEATGKQETESKEATDTPATVKKVETGIQATETTEHPAMASKQEKEDWCTPAMGNTLEKENTRGREASKQEKESKEGWNTMDSASLGNPRKECKEGEHSNPESKASRGNPQTAPACMASECMASWASQENRQTEWECKAPAWDQSRAAVGTTQSSWGASCSTPDHCCGGTAVLAPLWWGRIRCSPSAQQRPAPPAFGTP